MFVPPEPLVPRGAAGGVVGRRSSAATQPEPRPTVGKSISLAERRDGHSAVTAIEPLVLESLAHKPECAAIAVLFLVAGPPERRPPSPWERHTIWRSAVQNATNPSEIVADAARNQRSCSEQCAAHHSPTIKSQRASSPTSSPQPAADHLRPGRTTSVLKSSSNASHPPRLNRPTTVLHRDTP
jgi:hypothetical protein